VRWIAPILSFTAHEIWGYMPGQRDASVFVAEWYDLPQLKAETSIQRADWDAIMEAKEAINKMLETSRSEGLIKGSLDAEIVLYADDHFMQALEKLGDELRFVTITSTASLLPMAQSGDAPKSSLTGLNVAIRRSEATKCIRCWHYMGDVGSVEAHPELCARCVDNVAGTGEIRSYA
jgi:isoleucyl-tRNA synthetase